MKHTLPATIGALAGVLGLGNAHAQSSNDWTGLYIGAHIGSVADPDDNGDRFEFDTNLDGNFNDTVLTGAGANAFSPGFCDGAAPTPVPSGGCDSNSGGTDYGIRAGYDWQRDSWVFGVVGEYSTNDTRDAVTAFSSTPARYTMFREIDGVIALRGRVGYAFGADQVNLVYAAAGIAWVQIANDFSSSNVANSFTGNGDDDVSGSQFGIGFERRLGENFSVGIEYLLTDIDDEDFRVRVGPGSAPPTNPFLLVNTAGTDLRRSDTGFDLDSLRLTGSYRF